MKIDIKPKQIIVSFRNFWWKNNTLMVDTNHCDGPYIGYDAVSKAGISTLKYPVQGGIITDWNAIETLWHYTFDNELKIKPEEHTILMSEQH